MRTRPLLIGLGVVLAAAGCTSTNGHGNTPSQTSTTSSGATSSASTSGVSTAGPTSSISATATSTAWSTATALTHATSIVKAEEAALGKLSGLPATSSLAQAQAALRGLADADATATHQLAAGLWPAAVRSKVNSYIAALDSERRLALTVAGQKSVAAMQPYSTQVASLLTAVEVASTSLTDALKP